MAKWVFEPGHTAAEFCVRHMMVTWVRGHFKNVQGDLEFDPENPSGLSMKANIPATELWTGEQQRDQHLKSADFLDIANHPSITFHSTQAERLGGNDYQLKGGLTIRGVIQPVTVDLRYLGKWKTPYNDGHVTRVGFTGTARIDRNDFGVRWNSSMENVGIVVGSEVFITIDVEAILESELKSILGK